MALSIQNIKKYSFYTSLHARVCRVWIPKLNGQTSSFNCLFADNMGNAIQGSAKGKDIQLFATSIIEGDYYQISGFYTFENRYTNSVVAHEAVIDLKSDTKVARLNPLTPQIPRHYFNFIDFAHLLTKGKGSRTLTDVLGRLKAIQPLEQVLVRGQDITDKKEFIIENIRGDELRITLWGDVAKSFDDSILHEHTNPIIVVFAGFRVTEFKGKPNLASTVASLWYFNPEIPEILPYKHYYNQLPVEVYQLPASMNAIRSIEQQINENRKTIKEILCMDPYEHKSERFTCKASIADYDLHRGWWYQSCPLCTKSLSDKGTIFRCIEHNEVTSVPWFKVDCIVADGNDVATFIMVGKTAENFFGSSAHCYLYDKGFIDCIPPPMIEKLNKDKIFQLRFGAFRSVVNRCDIIVTNVFDDIVTAEAPPLPDEPELHIVDVPLNNQAASSSSKVASPLDPTTPTPIPPSKTNVDFSQQPQVSPNQPYMGGHFLSQAKRQLLFEDETHIQSSAIAVVTDPQGGFTPLDRDTSAIADANDPPSKRQRPFKQDRH